MSLAPPSAALLARLADRLGPAGFTQDPAALAPWLTDWRRRMTGAAAALVAPATLDEAAFVVAAAAEARVALVPQGGNSSMVGGATPPADGPGALLVSLRRMQRIRAVSPEDNAITAEAGVVLADLHEAAAAHGRRFPLSLAAKGNATVGGLISTNAGGTQVLRFGPMRALVLGLEGVFGNGLRLEQLTPLRKDNRGYDLKQLLIGAEGTLGLVTAATLRLVPAFRARAVAWIGLDDAGAALTLLRRLEDRLGEAVESFELIPEEGLALVLRHIPGTQAPLAGAHRWHVLIEAVGDAAVAPALEAALAAEAERGGLADAVLAQNERQAEALWRLRESLSEAEARDGLAAKHDIAVPVAAMPGFIETASAAVAARFAGARPIAFGHLGDGNVHFNVRAPRDADDRAWFAREAAAVSRFVHGLVLDAGGTLSAEHGIGRFKRDDFAALGEPDRLAGLRAVKQLFDPAGILNPGALLPLAEPAPAP
ncbi:FAD-binding oxidoreductase [Sphingomonas morindae]|uniref:FAD-binding oxidoreductase n=1 Tax=Sphingomonas morindae TaxID=1541170 RepID=A0ABY4X7K8_9SPHN|nr:FAD-binding oxidoreductase [Sphingomonas morindae]USI72918.1 FAD-binding oxidoreductase [Sphingomonas morindae]